MAAASSSGMVYLAQLNRAGVAAVRELTEATGLLSGELNWADPAAVLAWLDAIDSRAMYADEEFAGRARSARSNSPA